MSRKNNKKLKDGEINYCDFCEEESGCRPCEDCQEDNDIEIIINCELCKYNYTNCKYWR